MQDIGGQENMAQAENISKNEASELPMQTDAFFSTRDVICIIAVGLVSLVFMCLLYSYYQ